MTPKREHSSNNTQKYMVTSSTWERRDLFRNERWAKLMIDTLYHYRSSAYLLHEFVIMPDHIHALISPETSLEKAVQFIKGGFSHGVHGLKLEFNGATDGSAKAAPFEDMIEFGAARLEGARFQDKIGTERVQSQTTASNLLLGATPLKPKSQSA